MVKIKRIYAPFTKEDGYRVLVDRIWPRGMTKPKAKLDKWLKEAAPSTALRKWFGHDPKKWIAFQSKYKTELKRNSSGLNALRKLRRDKKIITLLYAAKDERHNNAVVLQGLLKIRR